MISRQAILHRTANENEHPWGRLSLLPAVIVTWSSLLKGKPHENFPLPCYHIHWYCLYFSLVNSDISMRDCFQRYFLIFWPLQSFSPFFCDIPRPISAGAVIQMYPRRLDYDLLVSVLCLGRVLGYALHFLYRGLFEKEWFFHLSVDIGIRFRIDQGIMLV